MKAVVVGRHAPDFGQEQIEVVDTINVQFAAKASDVYQQLTELVATAADADAVLLFQAVPGQLAAALAYWLAEIGGINSAPIKVGIVISKPGVRPAGVSMNFHVVGGAETIAQAIKFVNPNAYTSIDSPDDCLVTVDPPAKFEFSHIEWL